MTKRKMKAENEPGRSGPSSLFLLSEKNIIRRTTKFLIEWPYPFPHEKFILYN
uniref:Uncharacterized protein n=2 Tax=Lepeophtheirus salmonis TaxID=72036 RepID=A0A0K2TMZ8_LEPSM